LTDLIADLDAEMEQVAGKQRALGRLLTVPDKPGRPKPMTCKKYLLRGVATSPHIIYVCQREEEDLIELNGEESKPAEQWWRLAFTPHGDQSATKAEVGKRNRLQGIEGLTTNIFTETGNRASVRGDVE
jgi:hypothetical protein